MVVVLFGRGIGRRIWVPPCGVVSRVWGCPMTCGTPWWLIMNWRRGVAVTWLGWASSSFTRVGVVCELRVQLGGTVFSVLTDANMLVGLETIFAGGMTCPLLFSTSSCIFSFSTSFCSCSSLRSSSLICRSFSCSLRSCSSGTGAAFTKLWFWASACPCMDVSSLRWSSEEPGDTGGVELIFSRGCWMGERLVVVLDTSIGVLQGCVLGLLQLLGEVVTGCSWKGLSRSIRSVFVPDTGRPRNFNSSFSSATYQNTPIISEVISFKNISSIQKIK